MGSITRSEIVFPQQLTPIARQRLADELYTVHSQVFHAEDKAAFTQLFVESKADHTAIHLRRNQTGAIVSYAALHRYEKEVHGVKIAVFRAEAGALRNYRGHNSIIGFALKQILRYKLAHPTRPIFYLGMLLHPTSYMFFTKYGDVIWPNHKEPMPPAMDTLLADITATFGIQSAESENPYVVYVGVSTQETDEERLYWRTCDKPEARFFVQTNPNYSAGYGLLTLMPFRTSAFLSSIGRFMRDRMQRRFEPLLLTAQQLPLAKQFFGLQKIKHLLQQTPLCAELPNADLALLAQTAELIMLPAGHHLFRAGDASNELYVIATGSVYVVLDQDEAERIVDQLAAGAMFGEIGMLSGEARTATIRTATKCTLIRLKRKPLLTLMEAHSTLRTTIWNAYARRRFADVTANPSSQFATLSRQARLAWFAQGQLLTLATGEKATVQAPWLFVLTGAVETQQQQQWSTLCAPALVQVVNTLQIIAQTTTYCVYLPDPI